MGAITGSFLNVCIYRIPHGKSVVHPGSHCACGKPIPWYRNIPVLAWFFLRGKAPCCGGHFSVRYPIVEAATGGLFALCWALLPWQLALAGMVFVAWLTVLAFIDLDTMLLPDGLNIGLAAAGIALSVVWPELLGETDNTLRVVNMLRALGDSLAGALVGAGLVFWFRLLASVLAGREAMGEGDIILLGGIGAFCGWQGAVFALFGGAVIGSAILVPLLVVQKIRHRTDATGAARRAAALSHASCEGDEEAEDGTDGGIGGVAVPFGPWLALGAVAWFLFFRGPMAVSVKQFLEVLSPHIY
jgi:leader peptidase (prepilin peptidase)/N-methyltransferase